MLRNSNQALRHEVRAKEKEIADLNYDLKITREELKTKIGSFSAQMRELE